MTAKNAVEFPPFSLSRLLRTVFEPQKRERVAILIDLEDPEQIQDFAFLDNPELTIQRKAYDVFYQGLQEGVMGRFAPHRSIRQRCASR